MNENSKTIINTRRKERDKAVVRRNSVLKLDNITSGYLVSFPDFLSVEIHNMKHS
jgi:hypothetical protein